MILIAGGLAALGWLPHAGVAWTFAPQLAVGVGLGLALSALTERALAGRSAQAVHGGWTIAARHAGVVLGLLLLTPIFTTDLRRASATCWRPARAAILDSRIPPLDKVTVARHIALAVDDARQQARIPDVSEVVGEHEGSAYADLVSSLQDQLDRAVTQAFSRSFPRRGAPQPRCARADPAAPPGGERLMRPIIVAAAASLALIGVYLALGGASYAPARVADPCAPRDWRNPQGLQHTAEQIVLSALDGAACKLHVTREDMVLAFSSRASLAQVCAAAQCLDPAARRARPRRADAFDRRC